MRKVSSKRKSGRKSKAEAEIDQNISDDESEKQTNGDEGKGSDAEEEPETKKKRSSGKRKSVSFTSKKNDPKKEEQYEVERVLDEKTIRGVKHYLIRWKGYEPESDTWEPEDTLNCNDLIEEFYAGRKSNSEKSKKSKGSKRNKIKDSKIKEKEVNWSENDEFEVERILEVHHRRDGKREFLVSWKGYPSSENSWEPEENLTDCVDLIAKFMNKVEKAKEAEHRELREKRPHTNRFTLFSDARSRRHSKRNEGKQRVQYHDAE